MSSPRAPSPTKITDRKVSDAKPVRQADKLTKENLDKGNSDIKYHPQHHSTGVLILVVPVKFGSTLDRWLDDTDDMPPGFASKHQLDHYKKGPACARQR
jgi:hypothetical protein